MMRSSAGGISARVPAEFRRVLLEDRGHRVGGRVALERALAGEHFVEHGAEREQIASRPSTACPRTCSGAM